MRALLALLFLLAGAVPAMAERFVAISFHGVVDDEKELGSDDITTGRLIAFFDWLKGSGWNAVSLDDIAAARAGTRPLPPRAILLTFDDGYRDAYTRVFPLLLAYRYPAVFALVGTWMDASPDGTVLYGDTRVPREKFMSWAEAREMAASGLAEFASHSYNLHKGVLGSPQGSRPPAASTWIYDPRTGLHETDAAIQARILADFRRSMSLMRTHLSKAPRTLVWPYGRYSGPALAAARQAGFTFALTLDPEPADTANLMAIPRLFPVQDPKLGIMAEELRFADPNPATRRVVCLALDPLAQGGPADQEQALGKTIEALRRLGANTVVLDPSVSHPPGTPMGPVWFRTPLRPMAQDLFSFIAWQLRSRAGVDVYARVDLGAAEAAMGRNRVAEFTRDLVRNVLLTGLLLEPAGDLLTAGAGQPIPAPWLIRAARNGVDPASLNPEGQRALEAWRAAVALRPSLRLALPSTSIPPGPWPAPAADWLLTAPTAEPLASVATILNKRGWLAPDVGPRIVLPLQAGESEAAIIRAIRRAQGQGATAFSLCPAPSFPTDPGLNAAFSAASFPRLP